MPESFVRSKRSLAAAVAATVVGVSAAVLLSGQTTTAHAAVAPGSTVRASVADNTNAQAPDGGSAQELSADGTAVAFSSYSQLDDLATGQYTNVFVRDLRNNRTVMISRGQFVRPAPPPEDPPIGLGAEPMLSLNGRTQPKPPLPGPPLPFEQVPPNGDSDSPTISADGRYVAFVTQADNLLTEDDDSDQDLLVCDRDPDGDGVFDEENDAGARLYRYFRVNEPQWFENSDGRYRTDYPSYPKLSDDAGRIVWEDEFTSPQGVYSNVVRTAVLRPPTGAAVDKPLGTELVDTPLPGPNDLQRQEQPDVSGDGRYIVLLADYVRREGPVEFPDRIPFHAIIRKDTVTGAVLRVDWDVNTTPEHVEPLSVDESVHLDQPAISGDGGEVAFVAEAYENSCSEGSCWYPVADQPTVFVVRIAPDGTPVNSIVASRDNDNEIINGFGPGLSGDGRFLAFGTDSLNAHDGVDTPIDPESYSCVTYRSDLTGKPMVSLSGLPPTSEARDNRAVCQVVVRDLVVDRERLVNEEPRLPGTLASPGSGAECGDLPEGATCGGNDDSPAYVYSNAPSLSRNGSTIAYDSNATNLVAETDDNQRTDVFVRTFRPELRADPNPLEFGEVEVDDTFDRTVRFDHVGTGPLAVTAIEVVEGDEFTVGAQTCSGDGVVLQQADSCEVSVGFTPAAEGDRTSTLLLRLRDGREFTVPLRGTGTKEPVVPPDAARFAAGPDPVAFGQRLLLSTGAEPAVTVSNLGRTPLTVTKITMVSAVAPNDFAVATDTCTGAPVPPGGKCQVTVRFAPTAPGNRDGVLRFEDNAPGGPHLVGLNGVGSTPVLAVSPAVTQPGRVITVTGQGYAPNQQVTISLAGSAPATVVQTDLNGAFTKSVLIFPRSEVGTRNVVATVDSFPTIKAEKAVLIVTPSVGPAEFVIRG